MSFSPHWRCDAAAFPPMTVLGINAYHGDSSAAIVRDGKLIAAVEDERFNRVKHWAGRTDSARRWPRVGGWVIPGRAER